MAVSPRFGESGPAGLRSQNAPAGLRFGAGLGDAVANLVGKVDSSKMLELATTDILGMGIPRTAIEQVKRGPDAAREEAIRNFSATFTNVFLAGVYSYAFIKLFGRTKFYNPKGIPPTAFINAESLSAFGRMTEDILANEKIKSPALAKEEFYRRALASLQSGDHLLGQADFARASAEAGFAQGRGVAYSAKLDEGVIKNIVGQLGLSDAERAKQVEGVTTKPTWLEKLHLKKPGKNVSKLFYEGVVEPQTLTGLSEKVNLIYVVKDIRDERTAIRVLGRNRRQMLKEIGYFGEHFLSRAFEDGACKTGWKEKAVDNLTRKCSSLFLPKAGDGLIPYALKSKLMYTKWPILLTLITSMSVSFLNNWLTKRKHGGVNFFPGEGGPSKPGQQPQMAAMPPGGITRRPNVFAQFDLKNPVPAANALQSAGPQMNIPPQLLAQLMGGAQPAGGALSGGGMSQ